MKPYWLGSLTDFDIECYVDKKTGVFKWLQLDFEFLLERHDDCVPVSANRWTWVPRWLLQVTARKDKPLPIRQLPRQSPQVRDRRLLHKRYRRHRYRLVRESSGSCRWTQMVRCQWDATDECSESVLLKWSQRSDSAKIKRLAVSHLYIL